MVEQPHEFDTADFVTDDWVLVDRPGALALADFHDAVLSGRLHHDTVTDGVLHVRFPTPDVAIVLTPTGWRCTLTHLALRTGVPRDPVTGSGVSSFAAARWRREARGMPLVMVEDLDDPRLSDYRHLREPNVRARAERHASIFTVEGWLSLEALAESPYPVRSALVATKHAARAQSIVHSGVPVYAIAESALEQVTGIHFHRGILGVAERPAALTPGAVLDGARRVLVLEGVNDYENLGALFRNASAFGVDAVLLDPTTTDPLYRRATRVSLGHVLRVPFARVGPGAWPTILSDLRRDGMAVLALTPAADATPLGSVLEQLPDKVAVLVGAEGPGLSDEAMAAADHRVHIPMTPGTDSVNVATSAAIALAALYQPHG